MAEIIWNKNIQELNRIEINKYLSPYLWLVPGWCQQIIISLYPSTDRGSIAVETTTNYDYRNIRLDFYAAWLNEADECKQMHVVHELIHGFTSIIVDYAMNTINILCPESQAEKFNQHMQQELNQRCESSTQDLAYAIANKFKNG